MAGEGALPVDQCPGCGVLSTCSVLPRRCVEFKVPVAALGLRWLRSNVACWRRRLSVRGSFASSHQHRTGGHRRRPAWICLKIAPRGMAGFLRTDPYL